MPSKTDAPQVPALADEVVLILQRAYPGEVEKGELLDQSGLSDSDLREVLHYLAEEGQLDPDAQEFKWRDPSGAGGAPPSEDYPAEDPDEEPGDDPGEQPTVEATTPATDGSLLARMTLEVVVNFSRSPGESDDALNRKALQVSKKVEEAIRSDLPRLGVSVQVDRLEAWGAPRVIFPPE